MAGAVLRAEGLRKSYFRAGRTSAGSFDAVAGVDLTLVAGELVALTGRSGSGKTTLLSMLAGLLEPTGGRVLLGDDDLYALTDAERSRLRGGRIGVVPQGQAAVGGLTAAENVMLAQMLRGPVTDADEARARDLLARLGVGPLADSPPAELSGGELRRVSVARALAPRPAVLLADEPTGDLDDDSTALVLGALREAADGGCAVLVVTHDAAVGAVADRRLRLDGGELARPE